LPGPLPPLEGDIAALRERLSERKKSLTAAQSDGKSDVKEEDMTAPARDGHPIPVRIYRPASPPSGGSPLVVFYHGGGFCLGGLENEELNCRLFAQKLGCVCVNVDYRLAPENKFPTAVLDSWDTLQWAAANTKKLGADPSKGFVIGGTSAGGNIAAALALLARDEKLDPPLTGVSLLIPALTGLDAIPEQYKDEILSYEQNKDAPILGRGAIDTFMGMVRSTFMPSLIANTVQLITSLTKALPCTTYSLLKQMACRKATTFRFAEWIPCGMKLWSTNASCGKNTIRGRSSTYTLVCRTVFGASFPT